MGKNFFLNIGLGIIASIVAIWLIFIGLNLYTRHNTLIEVPNIKGIELEKAIGVLEEAGLRYEVYDSVYNEDYKRNAITEQDPESKSLVKPDRIIYLSINSLAKPLVKMPKLTDQSFALSKAMLKSAGLELGNVSYVYDEIGNNLVVEQRYNGSTIPSGRMIEKGSAIDLVVATTKRNGMETDSQSTEPLPRDLGE